MIVEEGVITTNEAATHAVATQFGSQGGWGENHRATNNYLRIAYKVGYFFDILE
jgi:hypothetical protein